MELKTNSAGDRELRIFCGSTTAWAHRRAPRRHRWRSATLGAFALVLRHYLDHLLQHPNAAPEPEQRQQRATDRRIEQLLLRRLIAVEQEAGEQHQRGEAHGLDRGREHAPQRPIVRAVAYPLEARR